MSELVNCNNLGRSKYLLLKMPNVLAYKTGYTTSYQVTKFTTISIKGGFQYSFTGQGDIILGIKAAGKFAYGKWLHSL